MIYEAYEQKILRIRKFRDTLYKYKFLILGIILLIMSCVSGLLISKGDIINDLALKATYEYGDKLDLNATAFLSKVEYEFREENGEWGREQPRLPGNYEVRTVTNASFNLTRRGKANSFRIASKKTSVIANGAIVYGENPTLSVDGLVSGDKIDTASLEFTFSNFHEAKVTAQLVEGSFKILDWKGEDITYAYDLGDTMYQSIPLTIERKELVITFGDAEKIYDGTPLLEENYETTSLAFEDEVHVKGFASLATVGECANLAHYTVVDSEGKDISSRYRVRVEKGTLSVRARPITITTNSAEKTYDGQPLTDAEIIIGGEGLVDGQELVRSGTASLTTVGEVDNSFKYTIMQGDEDVSAQYAVTTDFGTLTVNKRYIGVKASDVTKIYDGEAVELGYSMTPLPIYSTADDPYDAGDYYDEDVGLDWLIGVFMGYTTDLVAGHRLEVGDIGLRYKTVTVPDNEEIYLDLGTREVDLVGTYISYLTDMKVYDEDGNSVGDNYMFVTETGTVTINPRPIVLVTDNETKVYDGGSHVPTYHILPGEGLSEGLLPQHYEVAKSKNMIYAGEYVNAVSLEIYGMSATEGVYNTDVSSNYKIINEFGTLTITPRPILVRGVTAEKVYDGTPFDIDTFEICAIAPFDSALAIGDTCTVQGAKTDIHVGVYENKPEVFEIKKADGLNIDICYKVFYEYGELTITPRPLTVIMDTQKTYDGERINAGYTLSNTLGENDYIQIDPLKDAYENYAIDIGMYEDNRLITIYHAYSSGDTDLAVGIPPELVTDNYDIAYTHGILEIVPRPITVTLKDKERPYTGEPFTYAVDTKTGLLLASEYTSDTLLVKHTLQVKASGSQTSVGVSEGTITDVQIYGTADKSKTDQSHNYAITLEKGLLTVVKRSVIITPYPYSRGYNGEELAYPNTGTTLVLASIRWNCSSDERKEMEKLYGKALLSGDVLEADVLPEQSIIDVGETIFYIDAYRIFDSVGNEVQNSYYDVALDTTVGRVTQAKLVIRSADLEMVYKEGVALVGGEEDCWIYMGKLYSGHTIEYVVDASLEQVGTAVNRILEARIYDGELLVGYLKVDENGDYVEGNDNYYNYYLTFESGTLTITEQSSA